MTTHDEGYFPPTAPCLPEFEMVALTERRRIENGQPTQRLVG